MLSPDTAFIRNDRWNALPEEELENLKYISSGFVAEIRLYFNETLFESSE